jgi:excisionase family DNA binding protein
MALRSHDVDRAASPACTRAGDSTRLPTKGVSMASLAETTRFLTVERASVILGVPVPTLQRHLRAGALSGIKVGRQWRIPASAIAVLEHSALKGGER